MASEGIERLADVLIVNTAEDENDHYDASNVSLSGPIIVIALCSSPPSDSSPNPLQTTVDPIMV